MTTPKRWLMPLQQMDNWKQKWSKETKKKTGNLVRGDTATNFTDKISHKHTHLTMKRYVLFLWRIEGKKKKTKNARKKGG